MRLRLVHMKKRTAAKAERRTTPAIVTPAIEPLDILLGRLASGVEEKGSPMFVGFTARPVCGVCDAVGNVDDVRVDEEDERLELARAVDEELVIDRDCVVDVVDIVDVIDVPAALVTTPSPPTAVMKGCDCAALLASTALPRSAAGHPPCIHAFVLQHPMNGAFPSPSKVHV
jgi:hypothetical protein